MKKQIIHQVTLSDFDVRQAIGTYIRQLFPDSNEYQLSIQIIAEDDKGTTSAIITWRADFECD